MNHPILFLAAALGAAAPLALARAADDLPANTPPPPGAEVDAVPIQDGGLRQEGDRGADVEAILAEIRAALDGVEADVDLEGILEEISADIEDQEAFGDAEASELAEVDETGYFSLDEETLAGLMSGISEELDDARILLRGGYVDDEEDEADEGRPIVLVLHGLPGAKKFQVLKGLEGLKDLKELKKLKKLQGLEKRKGLKKLEGRKGLRIHTEPGGQWNYGLVPGTSGRGGAGDGIGGWCLDLDGQHGVWTVKSPRVICIGSELLTLPSEGATGCHCHCHRDGACDIECVIDIDDEAMSDFEECEIECDDECEAECQAECEGIGEIECEAPEAPLAPAPPASPAPPHAVTVTAVPAVPLAPAPPGEIRTWIAVGPEGRAVTAPMAAAPDAGAVAELRAEIEAMRSEMAELRTLVRQLRRDMKSLAKEHDLR
ncbi:MAG: hypothetical protein AB1726_17320 [Planctomycetota bacterium]